MLLHQRSRLLAFAVTSPLASTQQPEDQTGLQQTAVEAVAGADGDLSRLVLRQLSLLLPSHSVPDTLVVVPALCQTPHGEKSQSDPRIQYGHLFISVSSLIQVKYEKVCDYAITGV